MKTKVWLIISATLLISTQSLADDPGYGGPRGNTRQFNANPGNMMGGMFNPMHNFFDNYRPAPPPPTYGPGYGYPGAAYPYPPVYPGYQPPRQAVGAPPPQPAPQAPAAPVNTQPPPPATTYRAAPSGQPVYTERYGKEQYRFRPLESTDPSTQTPISEPAYQQPRAPIGYLPTEQAAPPGAVPPGSYSTGQSDRSNFEFNSATQERQMIFRPLDKPGYSE